MIVADCPECGPVDWELVGPSDSWSGRCVVETSRDGRLLCRFVVLGEDLTPDGVRWVTELIHWKDDDIAPHLIELNLGFVHWTS